MLRIGKHKRCSLSIYHTSFDPHQLHYSIATHTLVKRKKEIFYDLKTSVCYLSLVFSRSSFYSAQICKNASAIFLSGFSFENKIRFKRYSNDFKGNCSNSFYPIYILLVDNKNRWIETFKGMDSNETRSKQRKTLTQLRPLNASNCSVRKRMLVWVAITIVSIMHVCPYTCFVNVWRYTIWVRLA